MATRTTTAQHSVLDYAGFPHIGDLILDELCATRDARTLRILRLVSPSFREAVDKRISKHLVVKRQWTFTRLCKIRKDWRLVRPSTLDLHHSIAFWGVRSTYGQILEDPLSRVKVLRYFQRHAGSALLPISPPETLINFRPARHWKPTDDQRYVVFNLDPRARRNVLRLGYSTLHGYVTGLYYVLPEQQPDTCDTFEIVILLVPCEPPASIRSMATPPAHIEHLERLHHSSLNVLVQQTVALVSQNHYVSVIVVGSERWDEAWVDPQLIHAAVAADGRDAASADKNVEGGPVQRMWERRIRDWGGEEELRSRLSFTSWDEFKTAEPELYDLCLPPDE